MLKENIGFQEARLRGARMCRLFADTPGRAAFFAGVLLFLCLYGSFTSAFGDLTSSNFAIPRDVTPGGGGLGAVGGSYANDEVVGQPSPVAQSNSTDYVVNHGYLVQADVFPNVIYSARLTADSHSHGVAWTDFDGDGNWDLFVTRGTGADNQDYVFRNNGNETFTEVTSPMVGTESVPGFGVAFADYDNDGKMDGYVQNTGTLSCLWRDDGTQFSNQTVAEGITPISARMPSWGDYDGDGLVDLVTVSDSGAPPRCSRIQATMRLPGAEALGPRRRPCRA